MTPVRTFDAINAHRPLATTAEAQAGSNATDVMTPARTFEAIDAHRPFATTAEAQAGSNTTDVMTPARTFEAINALSRPLATTAEAQAGSNTTDVMTPARTFEAVSAATMVAAGGSHKAGSVPDPGVTAGLKRVLGDDAAFHGAKDQRLWAQVVAGKVCRLEDYGLVTGPTPGVDNTVALNIAFANATAGDIFVLPTTGNLGSYGQLLFFDSQPQDVPSKCTLTGPNESPSSAGVVRRFNVSDFRQCFIRLSQESCTVQNMTIYIADGYSSGAAVGTIQQSSEFYIHPRIRNVNTTCFGSTAAWAMPICLDGSASDGVNSKGIREPRIDNCAFWQYSQYGMYLRCVTGGTIDGITLTPALGVTPSGADLLLDGTTVMPFQNNTIMGGQIGANCIVGNANNNVVIGDVGIITFTAATSLNNQFIAPTYRGAPVFNFGANNTCLLGNHVFTSSGWLIGSGGGTLYKVLHVGATVSPGGIAANSYVDVPLSIPGTRTGDSVIINQPPNTGPVGGWVSIDDNILIRFHNTSDAPVSYGDTTIYATVLSFAL
jgi:hypothetical protein